MDKETLSNYGWIVICVLLLAVMIALATPFGTFVADAVKSTTQGLFDMKQNALNNTGLINIDGQEFDSCAHDYEITTTANCTTAGTTIHTCKFCGKSYSEETPVGHIMTGNTCDNCGVVIITFTFGETAFQAEEGMTWYDVCYAESGDEFYGQSRGEWGGIRPIYDGGCIYLDGVLQKLNDLIVQEATTQPMIIGDL